MATWSNLNLQNSSSPLMEQGIWLMMPPMPRMSWSSLKPWMMTPAHMNSKALNNAWVNKWKKAKS